MGSDGNYYRPRHTRHTTDSKENAGPPCKACSDFKSWAKSQKSKINDKSEEPQDNECPLGKEELGRKTWGFLHTMAAYYPDKPTRQEKVKMEQFFKAFAEFYPCHVCASHFQEDLKKLPPNVNSSDCLSKWLCQMHNRVNVRLGKPTFDCSRVIERWKDGWKDGSCD